MGPKFSAVCCKDFCCKDFCRQETTLSTIKINRRSKIMISCGISETAYYCTATKKGCKLNSSHIGLRVHGLKDLFCSYCVLCSYCFLPWSFLYLKIDQNAFGGRTSGTQERRCMFNPRHYEILLLNRERQTRKKSLVEPESTVPYWMVVCLARSSAESIGVSIRSMVRNAARLAVYDEMMMSVKNHHALPMIRPANDLQSPSS